MEGQTNLNSYIENDIRSFWRKEFELLKSVDFFNEVYSIYDVKPTDSNIIFKSDYEFKMDEIFNQEYDFWKKVFEIFDVNIFWNKSIFSIKQEYIKSTERHFKKMLLEKTNTFKIFFRLYLDIFIAGNLSVSNTRKLRFVYDIESNKDKINIILEGNLKKAIKNPEYTIISSKRKKIEDEISGFLTKDEYDNFEFLKLSETREFFKNLSSEELKEFQELSKTLLPREKNIVYSYLGIGKEAESFSDISSRLFTTEKKISSVLERSLRKLNCQIRLENDFYEC